MAPPTATETELLEPENVKLPSLAEIKRALPQESFQKSLPQSCYYVVQDFAILAALYYLYPSFAAFKLVGLLVWWNLMGVFGFSLFVIGHDCGHGSFSDHTWINDIVGHLCHAPLFVPFWPWQKSHRLHHTYTSHYLKDKGHPWFHRKDYDKLPAVAQWFNSMPFAAFFNWFPLYTLAGIPDGSHFCPFGRLYSNRKERLQCLISVILCLLSAWLIYHHLCGDWRSFALKYVLPNMFFGYMLTLVTYLHHKNEDVQVFEEGSWGYVKGAFQTIDRPYGFGLDFLMHHITDCHVVHHLFFTQIPHYRLPKATAALRSFIKPYGVYKRQTTFDYIMRFAKFNFILKYLDGEGTLTYPTKKDD